MNRPITISSNALNQFKNILLDCKNAIGIRVGIKKAGCTGYMFFIDPVVAPQHNDYKLIESEINIFINKDVISLISGTEVDYQIQGFSKKFVYNNPNVKMMCGCGDSFNI